MTHFHRKPDSLCSKPLNLFLIEILLGLLSATAAAERFFCWLMRDGNCGCHWGKHLFHRVSRVLIYERELEVVTAFLYKTPSV